MKLICTDNDFVKCSLHSLFLLILSSSLDSAAGFFADLKNLIEETYKKNGQEAIMLISHSLGCPLTLRFLNKQPQEWKDKYIKAWVTIAGAWGGAAKLWRLFASGTNLGFPDIILEPLSLRPSIDRKSVV